MTDYFAVQLPPEQIRAISSIGLAHLGDAVFELLVRTWLCAGGKATGRGLHRATVALVCAPRQAELAEIAGYLHDIGNIVNREEHAQSGAIMAFRLLDKMGMDPEESAEVICAIGNHDEGTAQPVSDIAAALILADKTDVRHTRVRNKRQATFDIHDRVNWSVRHSELALEPESRAITLLLTIDTEICSVMEYFEIFLERMVLCKKSAARLDCSFELIINDTRLL